MAQDWRLASEGRQGCKKKYTEIHFKYIRDKQNSGSGPAVTIGSSMECKVCPYLRGKMLG
jgi:hypothetical protein